MPRGGFEFTILVFERPKTVHALDCATIGTGPNLCLLPLIPFTNCDRTQFFSHFTVSLRHLEQDI
jgi:hypothetical protein